MPRDLTQLQSLKDRPVAVAGGGRSGKAAFNLLQKLGAKATLFDDRPEVSAHNLNDKLLLDADLVVLSPGIARTHPAIAAALECAIPVVNEIELAAAYLPDCRFVGITGTNGKSTTTTILGSIAKAFDPSALVGGNLGTPLCEAVLSGHSPALAVLELSSFQLETIAQLSLKSAIVTNLAPDHLDRYDSLDAYYQSKAKIFELLSADGVASINMQDTGSVRFLDEAAGSRRFDFHVANGSDGVSIDSCTLLVRRGQDTQTLTLDPEIYLGAHNVQNAAAAAAGAIALGIDFDSIRSGLANYRGIAHRLEPIGSIRGVRWINDSKGTNVDATLTALKSFESGIHLILGGLGKGSSYAPLIEACQGRVKAIYAIGEEAPYLLKTFSPSVTTTQANTLERAVELAKHAALPGDVLLLSPACASYDQYENFVQRGEHFRSLFHQAEKEGAQ